MPFKGHDIESPSQDNDVDIGRGLKDKSCLNAIDNPPPDPPELAILLLDPWTWKLNNIIHMP